MGLFALEPLKMGKQNYYIYHNVSIRIKKIYR